MYLDEQKKSSAGMGHAIRRNTLVGRCLVIVVGLVGVTVLAACGSKSSSVAAANVGPSDSSGPSAAAGTPSDDSGSSGASSDGSSGSGGGGTASDISVRIANFYENGAAAGPALDIYVGDQNGLAATPIISNLAYGAVSDYVHPPVAGQNAIITLTALPAGSPTSDTADAKPVWQGIDNGALQQVTSVLTSEGAHGNGLGNGALNDLSTSFSLEKGTDANSASASPVPTPPSGQAEILATTQAVQDNITPTPGYYLMIDNLCAPPLNGDTNDPGVPEIFATDNSTYNTPYSLFPVAPGVHQVSVVAVTNGLAPTCKALTDKQGTTSITVPAGQQTVVYVYGTSVKDLHLVAAPLPQ